MSLRRIGFLSLRSLSCCASEYPTDTATQRESDEKAGCAPNAIVLVPPSATLVTRSSFSPFVRVIPYASQRPSGDRPPRSPAVVSRSHCPKSAGDGGAGAACETSVSASAKSASFI